MMSPFQGFVFFFYFKAERCTALKYSAPSGLKTEYYSGIKNYNFFTFEAPTGAIYYKQRHRPCYLALIRRNKNQIKQTNHPLFPLLKQINNIVFPRSRTNLQIQ